MNYCPYRVDRLYKRGNLLKTWTGESQLSHFWLISGDLWHIWLLTWRRIVFNHTFVFHPLWLQANTSAVPDTAVLAVRTTDLVKVPSRRGLSTNHKHKGLKRACGFVWKLSFFFFFQRCVISSTMTWTRSCTRWIKVGDFLTFCTF